MVVIIDIYGNAASRSIVLSLRMRVKYEGYNSSSYNSSYNHFNLDPIKLKELKLFNRLKRLKWLNVF